MLMAAFFAAAVAAVDATRRGGASRAGIAAAKVLALLHGFACITHRGNQVVSGVAINILAAGLTIVFGIAWFQRGGQTPALPPRRASCRDWPACCRCSFPLCRRQHPGLCRAALGAAHAGGS